MLTFLNITHSSVICITEDKLNDENIVIGFTSSSFLLEYKTYLFCSEKIKQSRPPVKIYENRKMYGVNLLGAVVLQ